MVSNSYESVSYFFFFFNLSNNENGDLLIDAISHSSYIRQEYKAFHGFPQPVMYSLVLWHKENPPSLSVVEAMDIRWTSRRNGPLVKWTDNKFYPAKIVKQSRK